MGALLERFLHGFELLDRPGQFFVDFRGARRAVSDLFTSSQCLHREVQKLDSGRRHADCCDSFHACCLGRDERRRDKFTVVSSASLLSEDVCRVRKHQLEAGECVAMPCSSASSCMHCAPLTGCAYTAPQVDMCRCVHLAWTASLRTCLRFFIDRWFHSSITTQL